MNLEIAAKGGACDDDDNDDDDDDNDDDDNDDENDDDYDELFSVPNCTLHSLTDCGGEAEATSGSCNFYNIALRTVIITATVAELLTCLAHQVLWKSRVNGPPHNFRNRRPHSTLWNLGKSHNSSWPQIVWSGVAGVPSPTTMRRDPAYRDRLIRKFLRLRRREQR